MEEDTNSNATPEAVPSTDGATPAAVPEAPPETGISATATFGTAEGTRKEGTFSRLGGNGFTEVVDAATGEVVARYETGTPAPE